MNYLPLKDAWLAVTGHDSSQKQMRRRIKEGVSGVRLEARLVNGRYVTTTAWVEQFLAALTEAKVGKGKNSNASTPSQKKAAQRRRDEIDRKLNKLLGIEDKIEDKEAPD